MFKKTVHIDAYAVGGIDRRPGQERTPDQVAAQFAKVYQLIADFSGEKIAEHEVSVAEDVNQYALHSGASCTIIVAAFANESSAPGEPDSPQQPEGGWPRFPMGDEAQEPQLPQSE